MKSRKAEGLDELFSFHFKNATKPPTSEILKLSGPIRENERISSESVIVANYKKIMDSFVKTSESSLVNFIFRQLCTASEGRTPENDTDFQTDRGCVDHIFSPLLNLEQRHNFRGFNISAYLDVTVTIGSAGYSVLCRFSLMDVAGNCVTILRLYMSNRSRIRLR